MEISFNEKRSHRQVTGAGQLALELGPYDIRVNDVNPKNY